MDRRVVEPNVTIIFRAAVGSALKVRFSIAASVKPRSDYRMPCPFSLRLMTNTGLSLLFEVGTSRLMMG